MSFKRKKDGVLASEEGFTLVEIMLVVTILIVLFALMANPTTNLLKFLRELETKRKLDALQRGIETVYKAHAWEVDSSGEAQFAFTISGTGYVVSSGSASDTDNLAALGAIASLSNLATTEIERDSMRQALRVWVSNRLQDASTGVSYHVIAFVSSGWNGELDSSFDAATGVLSVRGDDVGFLVSGLQQEIAFLEETRKMLASVRDAYQNYFTSLYLADSNRSVYIDRFANTGSDCGASSSWDASSGMSNSSCTASGTATDTGLKTALGLSSENVTTPWGRELLVDNSSASTRNPETVGNETPYTALLSAELPWGGSVVVTVMGIY